MAGLTAAAPSASEAAASATAVLVNMTSLLCRNDHRRVGGWGKGGATAIHRPNAGGSSCFPAQLSHPEMSQPVMSQTELSQASFCGRAEHREGDEPNRAPR